MSLFKLCSSFFLGVRLRLDAIMHVCFCLSRDTRVSLFLLGTDPNCFLDCWVIRHASYYLL